MRKECFTYLSSDGKHQIHAVSWIPDGEIRGVLQIAHGMREYVDRYDEFGTFLAEQGYMVTGNDHLGHGDSVMTPEDYGFFAEEDGQKAVLEDMHQLYVMTAEKYPGVPYFLFGHSMGSFFTRKYLLTYREPLAGAIICGTGMQTNFVLKIVRTLCQRQAKKYGWKYRSGLITRLAFGGNGYTKFDKLGDGTSWLSKNVENVKAYNANPKCMFIFTLNGYDTLFRTIYDVCQQENVNQMNPELPMFFVSGDQDPVGNFGKGVKKVVGMYRNAGIKDLTCKLYENDRHEILNELDRDVVYKDVLEWICARTGSCGAESQ